MADVTIRRSRVLLLAVGFVLASVGALIVALSALAFLQERDTLRSVLALLFALAVTLGLTFWLSGRHPGAGSPRLRLLPSGWRAVRTAAIAAVVGAALFGCVFVGALLLGGVELQPVAGQGEALRALLTLTLGTTLLQVIWEEYTFRGWPFSASVRAFGPHPVALVLGLLFGLAHLLDADSTVLAIVSTTLAGWLLSYVMLAFGDISVAIGVHFGWNLTQTALTGGELWTLEASENALLSGGPYGLEASLPGVVVTAAGAATAFLLYRRRWS